RLADRELEAVLDARLEPGGGEVLHLVHVGIRDLVPGRDVGAERRYEQRRRHGERSDERTGAGHGFPFRPRRVAANREPIWYSASSSPCPTGSIGSGPERRGVARRPGRRWQHASELANRLSCEVTALAGRGDSSPRVRTATSARRAARAARRLAWRARRRHPAMTFAMLWYLVALAAESTIFPLAEPVNRGGASPLAGSASPRSLLRIRTTTARATSWRWRCSAA